MAKKKENSSQQKFFIEVFVLILALIFVSFAAYFYWQQNVNNKKVDVKNDTNKQQTETKNDTTRVEAFKLHNSSPSILKLNLNNPANSTIENTKMVSVAPSENKIVVLDKNNKEITLIVTSASKMQKMTVVSEGQKLWQQVGISEIPKNTNITVVYNEKKEIVYLLFMTNK